ncbi:hypothetical protein [Pseudomonas asiatica]|uniref:hypothetical protein n=1 Tax=Pseudomonas asiatica TaxID=2219225 RepID=UPI0018D5CB11|nr:hypothetical protein [Pseudomonas asiatica]MBH3382116.1 hypothetical protein [Pseudomonas asiatica]
MERVAYQNLRFEIEAQISCALDDPGVDREACINSLMRTFLSALASQEIKRQQSKKDFVTFRRNPNVVVPGWAYHKPGSTPQFPFSR